MERNQDDFGTTSHFTTSHLASEHAAPNHQSSDKAHAPFPNGKLLEKPITIQIGDQIFTLLRETIIKHCHKLKASLLSEWFNPPAKGEDDPYLLQGDGTLFQYLYNYMVQGSFPLFYDPMRGFHYAKYAELLEAAKYWGVDGMISWLESKNYERAVEIQCSYHAHPVQLGTVDTSESGHPLRVPSPINDEKDLHLSTRNLGSPGQTGGLRSEV